MCKAYDELEESQKDMFDGLVQLIEKDEPSAWLPVIVALKDHLEIETLSQVPFRRVSNPTIKIAS
jgi:hypothetical protein